MPSSELRRQVEDLALRLVVGEPGATEWLPALETIRECAQHEGASGVSTAVASLLDNLRESASPEAALQEGIALLQKALDAAAIPEPTANGALAQDLELISDFTVESREHLASIETQ